MNLKRLDWILTKAQDVELTPWEESFINSMIEKVECFQRRSVTHGYSEIHISERQEAVLERIAEKV